MRKILSIIYLFMSFAGVFVQAATSQPQFFTFLVNSDIHQGVDTSRHDDQKQALFLDIQNTSYNTQAVLLAGDLTDDGSDLQFKAFTDKWIRMITSLMSSKPHGGLYLCKGNHDEVSGRNSQIMKFLKKEYGGFCYSFDIQGLHFACCAKYPQATVIGGELSWLKSDLKKLAPGTPVVIFFHYNILGEFSSWWSVDCGYSCFNRSAKQEKDYFFDAIKNYNIQCIFFGHLHYSYSALWRNKFRVACVGGDKYAVCQYTQASRNVDIMFRDGNGRLYSWDSILRNDFEEL